MTPFELWKKMIEGKVYSKSAISTRVVTIHKVGQLNDEELSKLNELINLNYLEEA